MMLVLNLSGEIVAVDPAVGKTLECDAKSLLGQPFWSACLAAEAAQPVQDAFEAGKFDRLARLSALPWRVGLGPPKRFATVFALVQGRPEAGSQVVVSGTEGGISLLHSRLAAHEFRSQLHSVIFSIGMLERYGMAWPEDRRAKQTIRIKSAAHQMILLMEDFLELERTENGELRPNPVDLALDPCCRRVVDEARKMDTGGHDLRYRCLDPEVRAWVDDVLLRHVLTNLLSNAFKYSPPGTQVDLTVERHNGHVFLDVSDRGGGLSNKDLPRIFEAFYRGSNSVEISGVGVGLSIVKRLVELQAGQIAVTNVPGGGSRFTVRFPSSGSAACR